MDIDGLLAILSLFEVNVKKLKSFLSVYQVEVDTVRKRLVNRLSQCDRVDSHIISVHDALLKNVNSINEIIIKLNFSLNISRPVDINQTKIGEKPFAYLENTICQNLNDIEIGETDLHSSECEPIQLNGEEIIYSTPDEMKILPAKTPDTANLNSNSINDKENPKDDDSKKAMPNRNDVEESTSVLSPADLELLENIDEGTSDPLKAVLGYKPKDDQRICRFYNPKMKGCFKGSSCRLLHQEFASNGTTKDTQLVESMPETTYVSAAPKPLGEVVRVLVTHVHSPTQLYVQFIGDTPPLVWSKEELAESEINLQCSPHVLQIVLALYDDGCYYRAQIIEEIDGLFKVFYVDYGNTNFVTMKDLAKCSDAISLKPYQANQCFIQGIKFSSAISELKKDECMQLLNSKIRNKELDVKLASRLPDGYVIEFLNSFADLPNQMVKRGYVEPMADYMEMNLLD